MARIRSVKPDFFLDFELAKLEPITRLFFIGLWTQADRDGRLEDEPHKLKVQIIPWDQADVEKILSDLHPKFINRYKTVKDGRKYIQINSWHHQKPHHTEKRSTVPPPITVKRRLKDGYLTGRKGEDSLNMGKESVQVPQDLQPNESEIMNWLAYKREKGQTYKPRGLNALWGVLRSIPSHQRKQAIDQSMANNWAGIFPPKGGNVAKTESFKTTKQPIIA
jgi:hypothetical protein